MAQKIINLGGSPNDRTGTPWRNGGEFINDNFTELYASITEFIEVRTLDDLPTPVDKDGVLTIIPENKHYRLNNPLSSPCPLSHPLSGRATWSTVNRSTWTYTGLDACFRDIAANGIFEIDGSSEFQAPNGDMWNIQSAGGSFQFQASGGASRFTNCKALGTLKGSAGQAAEFALFFGTLSNYDQGLIAEDMSFFEISEYFYFGNNVASCIHLTLTGSNSVGSFIVGTNTFSIGSNETVFDIDPSFVTLVDSLSLTNNNYEGGFNGIGFDAGGLDQTDLKINAKNNSFLFDSAVIGSASVTGNAVATSVAVNLTWNDIDFGTLTAGSNIERCTLTNVVNGEIRIDNITGIKGNILATFSATSSGGGLAYQFRFVKNGAALPDAIIQVQEVSSGHSIITILVPVIAALNDLIKPETTRETGSSDITIENYSMVLQQ